MKSTLLIITCLIAAFFGATFAVRTYTPGISHVTETAFDRVMNSGTLRCGYVVWPPEFVRDEKTGAFSGAAYDLITEAAKRMNLKIEWAEETDFSSVIPSLEQGRFDMLCFTIYRRALAAAQATHSIPLMYSGVGVFVRPDDHRFDSDLTLVNSPDITIATMDGEQAAIIADEQFPTAKRFSLPPPNDFSNLLLSVAQNKADISFANIGNAYEFMAKNPGLVRQINNGQPIRVFSHGYLTARNDGGLMKAFDIVFEEMQNHGFTDAVLKKYQPQDGVWFKPVKAYEAVK